MGIFAFIVLIALIAFIIGLVKPSLFSKLKIENRKQSSLIFGGLFICFFILFGLTAPKVNTTAVNGYQSGQKAASNSNIKSGKLNIAKITKVPTPTPTKIPTPTQKPTLYITPTLQQTQGSANQSTQDSSGLSNNNYYQNSSGNEVHSPAYSTNNQVPAGATAQCADGTYSFSQSRSGTCSHHGGVATWY